MLWKKKRGLKLATVDPFEPSPRHEDIRGARFWPDTFFVDVSGYPEEFQEFDGDELRLLSEGDLGIFVAAAARVHEQVHWLQTLGTTFGRFLALNRITTGDLAEAILTTASQSELQLLVDARRKGIAPAARSREGQLRHALGYSQTLQSLFDHWWSSVALEHYLVDDGFNLLGPVDPRFMVGLGLRYAAAGDGLRDVFNAPDATFMETTRQFGPRDAVAVPELRSGLKVRHIEEAAALVSQHLFNSRMAAALPEQRYIEFASRSLAWTMERFLDERHSLYTSALNYYGPHAPAVSDDRHMELFLLICDIALNPRIPDDGSPLANDWSDFHPVRRFERLVAALEGFVADDRAVEGAPPSDWWIEERHRLVVRAGLTDGQSDRAFPKGGAVDVAPLHAPTSFLRGFVRQAAFNLDLLRVAFPAVTASPLHASDPGEEAFTAALAKLNGASFDPPMIIKSGGVGEPSSISDRLYAETVTAVAARRATHSWLVRPGTLNFQGLPDDKGGHVARKLAVERLAILYGIEAK